MKKRHRKIFYYAVCVIFLPVGIVCDIFVHIDEVLDHAFYWLSKKLKIRDGDPN